MNTDRLVMDSWIYIGSRPLLFYIEGLYSTDKTLIEGDLLPPQLITALSNSYIYSELWGMNSEGEKVERTSKDSIWGEGKDL